MYGNKESVEMHYSYFSIKALWFNTSFINWAQEEDTEAHGRHSHTTQHSLRLWLTAHCRRWCKTDMHHIIPENTDACLFQWKFFKQQLWSIVCTPTAMGGCSGIYLGIQNNSQAQVWLKIQPDPPWQCMGNSNRWRKEVRESWFSGKGGCSSARKSWPSASRLPPVLG